MDENAQKAIDLMQLPDNVTNPQWSFETSDSTQKGSGQEAYVISGKRTSWYQYAIENNEDEIETLTETIESCAAATDVSTLSDTVTSLMSDLTAMRAANAGIAKRTYRAS